MNLLVTGAFLCTKEQIEHIESFGHKVIFMQYEKDELPCDYSLVDGIIGNDIFLHHPIQMFTSLKFIQLTSAGFDRVPMDYVKTNGIKIYNARGVYSIPMAEFALGGVLSLYKKLYFFRENQKQHLWVKHRGVQELYGKNILIVGAGNVGQECAKRFWAMGSEVYGVDVHTFASDFFKEIRLLSELDALLKKADVVILTLPLTDQTKNLFDDEKFSKMKQGALLVNISRGAVVNEDALIKALNRNLGGAVLDVFENEPLDNNSPLWDIENVVITPHNSFVGEENNKRLFEVVLSNLENFKRG